LRDIAWAAHTMTRTSFSNSVDDWSQTRSAERAVDSGVDSGISRTWARCRTWGAMAVWSWAVRLGGSAGDRDETGVGFGAKTVVFCSGPRSRSVDGKGYCITLGSGAGDEKGDGDDCRVLHIYDFVLIFEKGSGTYRSRIFGEEVDVWIFM
jgi:hypothetical protein